eukprot:Blabericola_migrator_1__1132@NODE_128_length_13299_cov_164_804867_g113_i0_p9_GENE_NODE_128_length_13299_cov_164_804867_g113_i0NODE_128_length_13299_cov_164_804867_g113_i0_p9_ORF_typecomplete_len298_score63_10Hydrolase_3/PF08282_12/5_8e43S6PP/PF05116_13/7_8e06HAD/PF12710_7/2e03HAD/PF12710_7/1_5e02HAD/PF12710_7/0_014Phage_term_smal/PF05944_12/0_062baeRF_family5/PF18846_1/0_13HAD_2/PF13419_6/1_2Trehalose_PPase/PF02358_16/0_2_NODE_128_length_13299_cov_164_804867_g113_i088529745
MQRPTWVASDMDETFLDSHHVVPHATREAYVKLCEAGVTVVPSTGRSIYALKRVMSRKSEDFYPKMKFTPGVYLNGTIVYGDTMDDIIYCHSMPMKAVSAFMEAYYRMREAGAIGLCTVFVQNSKGSIADYFSKYFDEHCERWCEEIPGTVCDASLLTLLEKDANQFSCCQLSLVGEPEDMDKFEQELAQNTVLLDLLKDNHIRLMRPIKPMITAVSNTESKAKGLRHLVQKYPSLRLDEVLTIGDGNNDIEMLQMAQWSFAMGQAAEAVKAAAKAVTSTTDNGGWAGAIMGTLLQN